MSPQNQERRKSLRRPVLETFNVFVSIPKKGPHRLALRDISNEGMRFDLDLEGESTNLFPVKVGETLELEFHLNPGLSIPLSVQVARFAQEETHGPRQIGVALSPAGAKAQRAFAAFVQLLDALVELRQA